MVRKLGLYDSFSPVLYPFVRFWQWNVGFFFLSKNGIVCCLSSCKPEANKILWKHFCCSGYHKVSPLFVSLTNNNCYKFIESYFVLCSTDCGKPCDVSLDFCSCSWLPCSNQYGRCHGVTRIVCTSSKSACHPLTVSKFSNRQKGMSASLMKIQMTYGIFESTVFWRQFLICLRCLNWSL